MLPLHLHCRAFDGFHFIFSFCFTLHHRTNFSPTRRSVNRISNRHNFKLFNLRFKFMSRAKLLTKETLKFRKEYKNVLMTGFTQIRFFPCRFFSASIHTPCSVRPKCSSYTAHNIKIRFVCAHFGSRA